MERVRIGLAILGNEKVGKFFGNGYHTQSATADSRQSDFSNLILLTGWQFATSLTMTNSLQHENFQITFCSKPLSHLKSILNSLQFFNEFGTESTEASVNRTFVDRPR
jgi:hypothetical protein